MDKLIPDPPHESPTPLEEAMRAEDLARNREAIKRALDYYLCPNPAKPRPSTMYMVTPNVDTESLLANACESLASASSAGTSLTALSIGEVMKAPRSKKSGPVDEPRKRAVYLRVRSLKSPQKGTTGPFWELFD